jgi:hypothetical protein
MGTKTKGKRIGANALRAAIAMTGSLAEVRKQYREGDLEFIYGADQFPAIIRYKFTPAPAAKNVNLNFGFNLPG